MTLKVNNTAKTYAMEAWKNDTSHQPFTLKLFKNNPVITAASVAGDFTEAAFGGYGSAGIAGTGSVTLNGSNEAQLVFPTVTFTATGGGLPEDIYGYYVLDTGGNLLWAETDPTGPITVSTAGDAVTVDLVITMTNLSPP